ANRKLAATADELAIALVERYDATTPLGEVASVPRRSVNPQRIDDQLLAHYSLPAFDQGAGPEIVKNVEVKSSKHRLSEPCVLVSKLNPRFPRIWNVSSLPNEMAVASTEFVMLEPNETSTG